MEMSSNRSPSQVSTKPNPHSSTSQRNSTVRRSFGGNPLSRPSILTNTKSTADFTRRHSVDKHGVVSSRGFEEKENERDQNLKPGRVRSPAVSNGTKNFMSPTISAASKITASPRKKVLMEKNEVLRTSVSFSNGKSPSASVFDLTSDMNVTSNLNKIEVSCNSEISDSNNLKLNMDLTSNQNKNEVSCGSVIADSNKKKGVLEVPLILKASKNDTELTSEYQVPLNSHNVSDLLSETMTVESNHTCVDTSSNKKPPSSPAPVIAPLDADPSLRPYDPKTNYLSPRPLFLHYRPNPGIELHFKKDEGFDLVKGKRHEDSFMSENFLDTEVMDETQSKILEKESEDASSAEMIIEEESHVSETKPISEETVEAKRVHKLSSFTRPKSISLLLVLLIACLSISVTDSPLIKLSIYKDLSFSELYNPFHLSVFVTQEFDSFARNLKQWSTNFRSYLSNLIGILGEVKKLHSLQFANLTALEEDLMVNGYVKVDHTQKRSEESYRRDELEHVRGGKVDLEILEEKSHPEVEADDPEIEEVYLPIQAEVLEADSSEAIQTGEQTNSASHIISEPRNNMELEVQSVLIPLATEIKTEVGKTGEFQADNDLNSCAKIESITVQEAILESFSKIDVSFGGVHSSEALNPSLQVPQNEVLVHYMLEISLLVLSLAAAIAFIYLKHGKTNSVNAVVQVDSFLTKKLSCCSVSARTEHICKSKSASQNWPTEIDVVGESCPSEFSSCQKSSSDRQKGLKGANEAQSQERRPGKNSRRRESLASSSEYSMGSPSYGSFTTYEKILSKAGGCGDEETVTPVRRSSRIRQQVTSP